MMEQLLVFFTTGLFIILNQGPKHFCSPQLLIENTVHVRVFSTFLVLISLNDWRCVDKLALPDSISHQGKPSTHVVKTTVLPAVMVEMLLSSQEVVS